MDGKLYQVVISPHITEKSVKVSPGNNRVTFRVRPWATKGMIKEAVEKLFKVHVEGVHVLSVRGKERRVGLKRGYQAGWKKAYIKLKQGEQIEVFHGMTEKGA